MAGPMMHLARKWRSQTFQTIHGQDLVVRILQNNLFRGYFFPLYLFAGPRGSGKTSTARIFAAAANCHKLDVFRESPREVHIPCQSCSSCTALFSGAHPDVIEVDAASYTGVDNIRSIIDSATFLPVMGSKKVYIVDEAHMLSKAAFNAFLKILEEPPESAIFILATTDPSKILNTIRSRSLQLYFERVDEQTLQEHLTRVCETEAISYEVGGIARLAQAAEGSVRDALQLLERVYLAYEQITRDTVITTLGEIDEHMVMDILYHLVSCDMSASMHYVHTLHIQRYAPLRVWYSIVAGLRALFWGHFGIVDSVWEAVPSFYDVVHMYDIATLRQLLHITYTYEPYVLKTTYVQSLFEMLFLDFKRTIDARSSTKNMHSDDTPSPSGKAISKTDVASGDDNVSSYEHAVSSHHSVWNNVMRIFEQESDPLLASVFKQAHDVVWDDATTLRITFANKLQFYHEWMDQHKQRLQTIVHRVCGVTPNIVYEFIDVALEYNVSNKQHSSDTMSGSHTQGKSVSSTSKASTTSVNKHAKASQYVKKNTTRAAYETVHDINDAEKWPFANMIMQAFPSSIKRRKKRE